MRKISTLLFALVASITMLQGATIDLATLTGEYTAQNGDVLTGTSNYVIRVAADATLTLNNAILNKGLFCNGDAVLVLAETNTISSPGEYNPAVNVAVNYTLTIQGDGSLTANGSSWQGAAIGAGKYVTCGNIIINNGTITTTSAHGPGIGAAYGATCGNITINGGTITVQQPSDNTAAGIGGSNASSCGNITINGGAISAIGTYYGPGIGGACGDITINGGTIDASDGYYGIGRGDMSTCGNLTIGSGITRVTASGRAGAINVGENTITIDPSLDDVTEGNTRTITPHEEPSHIIDLSTLTEDYTLQDGDTLTGTAKIYFSINIADGATVTFSDLNVTFASKWNCFNCLGSATINIADDTQNTLANNEDYYQSNAVITIGPSGSTLTINGTTGKLTINAGRYGPAIGSNGEGARGNIVINGGVIVATAGQDASAIGGRGSTTMGDITINGGTITANGNNYYCAIGANGDATCGTITINGGTVTAQGGYYGTGIGGRCSDIIIKDGVVNASVSSGNGVGIGSANERSCGNIIIKGGTVTATGSGDAPAIGAGVGGSCGMIYIASNMDDVTEGQTRTLAPNGSPVDVEQDENGYYLLGSLNNWKFFYLESLTDPTVKAKMTADIDLGTNLLTIGTIDAPYQGTFDGQGHKLTINFTPTEERFGLFRFIIGATIQNLHLTGTITTEYRMVGSLVGRIDGGTCNITNCRSSVYVHSTTDAGHQIGGFIGRINSDGILNISDCLFDGSVKGETSSEFCGGIVGYNAGTLNMSNCLFMPDTAQIGSASISTLVENKDEDKLNIVNSYYAIAMGKAQGTQATEEQLADGTIAAALQNGRDEEIWVQDPVLNTPMLKIFANPEPGPATTIDEANADVKATKRIVNGQLLIERGDKTYTLTGQEVK